MKQCGCGAGRWPKCADAWHLKLQHAGERYSISLDVYAKRRGLECPRTRGTADDLADRIVKEIETGTYQAKPVAAAPPREPLPPASDSGTLMFDQAWPKFVTGVLRARKVQTYKDSEGRFRKLAAVEVDAGLLGALPLTAITESHVEEVFVEVTEEMADGTRGKYKKLLVRFFKWAVRKGHLTVNPITEDTELHAGKGAMRTRRVKPDEEANLLEAASEGRSDAAWRLVALIAAALQLGLRVGELLALQWRDIEWATGRVIVRAEEDGAKKNGRARKVPLTADVEARLRVLATLNPEAGTPWPTTAYVFGDAVGGRVRKVRKAFVTAVLRAHNVQPAWTAANGLVEDVRLAFRSIDLHFHDLRHECALRWLERGYDLNTIAKLLGHSDLNTLRVYLGITDEDALAQADRLNREAGVAAEGPRCTKPALFGAEAGNVTPFRKGGARRQVAG